MPHQRPNGFLIAMQAAAESAPYAYVGGRHHPSENCRPATSPTPPPPPPSASKKDVPSMETSAAEEATPLLDVTSISKDPMPFSLVDRTSSEYRLPTQSEMDVLHQAFPSATEFIFQWPIVVVRCSEPPSQVPLTIGSVPALFLPLNDPYE